MPGNEVGDGVHNFFGQESHSQGQHHPQVIDGNWPGLSNTSWLGNQRHINASFNPNLQSYNVQHSDHDREHGAPSSNMPHGLTFMQSSVGPKLARNVSESLQPDQLGSMHGHQQFQTKQYENNFGQPQMSGAHPGLLHSQPGQQSGMGDMQILQQQAMIKQIQELQRRQQFQKQQQDLGVQNSLYQASAIVNQATDNALVNGIPVHDASNYLWQSETTAVNNNWLQQGLSPAVQGSAAGRMIPAQHSQALHLMGVTPERADQSFYGVPVCGVGGNSNSYSHTQTSRTSLQQQVSAWENSVSGNQASSLADRVGEQGTVLHSREIYQGKNMSGDTVSQVLNRENNFKNLHQATDRGITNMQDVPGRKELSCFFEKSQERTTTQVPPSENVATLDPIEEKILFGSDDSVWNVFGRSDGTDSAFASMSCGTWGALMQSAVAETSSNDIGMQEEWSGLSFLNTDLTGNQHSLPVNDGVEQPPTLHLPTGASNSTSLIDPDISTRHHNISRDQPSGVNNRMYHGERLQLAGSTQRLMAQYSSEGNAQSEQSLLQQALPQGSNMYGNVTSSSGAVSNGKGMLGSWVQQQNSPRDRHNGLNLTNSLSTSRVNISSIHGSETDIQRKMANDTNTSIVGSVPNLAAGKNHSEPDVVCPQLNSGDPNVDNTFSLIRNSSRLRASSENDHGPHHHDNLGFWKHVEPSMRSRGNTMPADIQSNLGSNPQSFASSWKDGSSKGVEKNEAESDSFHSNASQHVATHTTLREISRSDAGESQHLPGSKGNSFNEVGRKQPRTRKFQYHPMGDVDINEDPSYGSKKTAQSQAMHMPVSRGLVGADQEQSKVSSQNMLELLHKVDQYERGPTRSLNSPRQCPSSEVNAATYGHCHQTPSISQSFGLQLAPSSQTADSPNSNPLSTSLKRTFSGLQKPDDPNAQRGVGGSSESAAYSFQGIREAHLVKGSAQQLPSTDPHSAQGTASASQDGSSVVNHFPDACSSEPGRTQNNNEAMNHSQNSEKISQNLSLPHPMHVKNSEFDILNGNAKRFKGIDGSPEFQPVISGETQQSYQENQSTIAPAKDMVQFGFSNLQKFPSNCKPAFTISDRPQISPQMAPSWFGQFGAFQNGQILVRSPTQKAVVLKTVDQSSIPERASEDSLTCNPSEKENSAIDDSKLDNIQQTSRLALKTNEFSSPQLSSVVAGERLTVGLNRSKSSTIVLLPWFKEVIMGSHTLQSIGNAEVEWARATNRLIEKVEGDANLFIDGLPRVRSKRRLTLTTQFMQQLLRPPLASILSVDASISYENVVYFVARLALGDACRSISSSRKNIIISHDSENLFICSSSEKAKELERIDEPNFSKVTKDFIDRAKKLEGDLLRLEKGVSILDLRLECQDLEKFSVINRFAKFHSRGQTEGVEASSSSDSSANLQRPCPQRHVTALQMPRNIPDRVQCLSL